MDLIARELNSELKTVQLVLSKLQEIEPAGLFARNLERMPDPSSCG
jgi:DNA-directed RNA polymerase specialized sigma54-like protein